MSPRVRLAVAATTVALLLHPTSASADWATTRVGHGSVTATTVLRGATPTVQSSGTAVTLSWAAGALATGQPVGGYDVYRHAADGSTALVCSTTEPVRTCQDPAPGAGTTGYGVVPRIGLHWTGQESPLAAYTADTTAPQSSLSTNPQPNAAGWHRTAVQVTVSATDAGSGVASVTYRLGSGSPVQVSGDTATVAVSAEGTTTVTYYATDRAGNVESPARTAQVRIDTLAPAKPEITSMSDDSGSSSSDRITNVATVTLGGTAEPGSAVTVTGGAAPATGTANGVGSFAVAVPLSEGVQTLTATATDVAGNQSAASTGFTVTLDRTVPALTVTDPRPGVIYNNRTQGQGSNRWSLTCGSKPGACGTAADPGSGIASLGLVLKDTTLGTCWTGTGTSYTAAACGSQLPVTGVASWSRLIDYTVVTGRQLTLTVTGTDVAGNVATQQVAFRAE